MEPTTPAGRPAAGRRLIGGPKGRLRVDDGGSGPAVPALFVHGGAADLTHWSAQLAHLRQARRAVALDLRGMGGSDRPRDGDYSLAGMAEDVHAVAETLGLERLVLVGHSYGGGVISAYAARHPERLAALVYVDCWGLPWNPAPHEREELEEGFRPESFAAFTQRWFQALLEGARERTRRAVMQGLRRTPREVLVGTTVGALGFDPRQALAGYAGPIFAVGAEGSDGPRAAQRALPVADFRILKGASHWLMMDRPEELDAALDGFLSLVR